ncbi:BZ3500_MvSof-1268-A1-R1_Chr4-1g06736 [Microbotryum saponariae]|uniref:BZ3500_MvSof-1268-A1-R1_Chr4-1g06736 protein n=1 Tax=Microbotryum saponariae TaxID=289078 RepID=A0A2X0LHD9_9BASI|nr:BZ3500_MvSof-1268-A1-R1_Chr4-1g06736 [Microbotryum saponariae]SDA06401.1 BZ3501_MvSof-1269-A2-R1_Chr4-1g06446 [Microbotryum saponariae]
MVLDHVGPEDFGKLQLLHYPTTSEIPFAIGVTNPIGCMLAAPSVPSYAPCPAIIGKTTLLDLPLDIIECIIDAVLDFADPIRTTTLSSLSLASKSWGTPAQKALHFSPYLSPYLSPTAKKHVYERMSMLHASLSQRPDLASAVRSLHLGNWTSRARTEAKIDRRHISKLSIEMIGLSPNITFLDLPGVTHVDTSDLHLALAKLSSIKSFSYGDGHAGEEPWIINYNPDIRAIWGTAPLYFDELAKLVGPSTPITPRLDHQVEEDEPEVSTLGSPKPSWPHLKHLTLRARLRSRNREEDSAFSCQLESLTIAFSQHAKTSYPELSRILSNSQTTLTRLDIIEHQILPGDLVRLLESHGSHLTDLRTTTSNQYRLSQLVKPIARSCPALKRLELGSYLDALYAIQTFRACPDLESIKLTSVRVGQYEPTNLFDQVAAGTKTLLGQPDAYPRLRIVELTENVEAGERDRPKNSGVTYRMRLDRGTSDRPRSVEVAVRVFW